MVIYFILQKKVKKIIYKGMNITKKKKKKNNKKVKIITLYIKNFLYKDLKIDK